MQVEEDELILGNASLYRDLHVLRGSVRQCWVITQWGHLPCCQGEMAKMTWLGDKVLDGFVAEISTPEPLDDVHLSELCLVRSCGAHWAHQDKNEKQHFRELLCKGKAIPVPEDLEDVCDYLTRSEPWLQLPEHVKQNVLVHMDMFLRRDGIGMEARLGGLRFQIMLSLVKDKLIVEVAPGIGDPQRMERLGKWITWYVTNKKWLADAKFWAAVLLSKDFLVELERNQGSGN